MFLSWCAQIFVGCVAADATVAAFRWWRANFLFVHKPYPNLPFLKSIAMANHDHSRHPRVMLACKPTDRIRVACIAGAALSASALIMTRGHWLLCMLSFWVVVTCSPIMHQWLHMVNVEHSPTAGWILDSGLFVTPEIHHMHHVDARTHYGTIFLHTDWLYERVGLWRILETLIYPIFGHPHQQ